MKKTLFLSLLLLTSKVLFAQDAETILQQYLKKAASIQTASYEVERIDTFASGDTRIISGKCFIERNAEIKPIGYRFKSTINNFQADYFFDEKNFLVVSNKDKTIKYESKHPNVVFGIGGQILFEEILKIDDSYLTDTYNKVTLLENSNDNYVLEFQYPDNNETNIIKRKKILYLDKSTLLAYKSVSSNESSISGTKQVIVKAIKNIEINKSVSDIINDKLYLQDYAVVPRQNPYAPQRDSLIGKKVPDFKLISFNGDSLRLAEVNAKVILLDFWEVWCGPCLKSMPTINEFQEKYKEKGLKVIGLISETKSLNAAKTLVEKKQITIQQLLADAKTISAYKVRSNPRYVILDKNKHIVAIFEGFSPDIEKTIEAQLSK